MTKPAMKKDARPLLMAALFCEKILEEKDNVMTAVRIVDRLLIPKATLLPPKTTNGKPKTKMVPAAPIMALIAFKSGDAKGKHLLQLRAVSPSGRRAKLNDMPMEFLGGGHGVNVRATILADVSEEGLHWYHVYVDKKLVTRMPLEIVHVQTPPEIPPSRPAPKKEK